MYLDIKRKNPDLSINHVYDKKFKKYGTIIDNIDFTDLVGELNKKNIPDKGNVYVASDADLENIGSSKKIQSEVFGNLPIEVGYCNGHSYKLNALEWHNSPEFNIATKDIVLFLGQTYKLHNNHYSVKDVEPFYIPAGTAIALYGTTMHFAPIRTSNDGFRCLVALINGINSDLNVDDVHEESATLFKKGKWLITHPENDRFVSQNAFVGIDGKNLELKI